jgi:predicted N-acetyltransferase YhbS
MSDVVAPGTEARRSGGGAVVVRPMQERDLDAADRVMRRAFGTYFGVADPEQTFGGAEVIRPRFRAEPAGSFVAVRDGVLVGSVQAARWGSFAVLGPLTVHEDLWDQGIARALMAPVIDLFDQWHVSLAGLHTFAQSAKHVALYQRFGFWPLDLTAIMSRPVSPPSDTADEGWRYSTLGEGDRARSRSECAVLTGELFEGLDVGPEIDSVLAQSLGDTILVTDDAGVAGFAVCHCAGGEAGPTSCFVKFAAVRRGPGAADGFARLLSAIERHAHREGVSDVVLGMSLAHRDAYRQLRSRGYRSGGQGVRMHRPDDQGYCRADLYVIDDLR